MNSDAMKDVFNGISTLIDTFINPTFGVIVTIAVMKGIQISYLSK